MNWEYFLWPLSSLYLCAEIVSPRCKLENKCARVDRMAFGGGVRPYCASTATNQKEQTKINVKVEFKAFLSESILAGWDVVGAGTGWFALLLRITGPCQEDHVSHTFVLLFK